MKLIKTPNSKTGERVYNIVGWTLLVIDALIIIALLSRALNPFLTLFAPFVVVLNVPKVISCRAALCGLENAAAFGLLAVYVGIALGILLIQKKLNRPLLFAHIVLLILAAIPFMPDLIDFLF